MPFWFFYKLFCHTISILKKLCLSFFSANRLRRLSCHLQPTFACTSLILLLLSHWSHLWDVPPCSQLWQKIKIKSTRTQLCPHHGLQAVQATCRGKNFLRALWPCCAANISCHCQSSGSRLEYRTLF